MALRWLELHAFRSVIRPVGNTMLGGEESDEENEGKQAWYQKMSGCRESTEQHTPRV